MLTDVERRYSQCEKEALAAVSGCERLWYYLLGSEFKLITDNRAVQLIFSSSTLRQHASNAGNFDSHSSTSRSATRRARPTWPYSRHPDTKESLSALEAEQQTEQYINLLVNYATPGALTVAEIAAATKGDKELVALMVFIKNGTGKLPSSLSAYQHVLSELAVSEEGILLRGTRIVIQSALKARVLGIAHAGHQGIVKTKRLIRSKLWFPGIDALAERVVRECVACQAANQRPENEPLKPSPLPSGPWEQLSADFYGPMKDSKYYLVVYDEYSRYVVVSLLSTVSADAV